MTEERKFAILIAATILSARKLAELEDPDKPTPKKIGAIETAIRHAVYIPGEIDKKWPTKRLLSQSNKWLGKLVMCFDVFIQCGSDLSKSRSTVPTTFLN